MPVVVLQKPKEKQIRHGWRVKTKVTQRVIQRKDDRLQKEQARRSAHNYLLLRELGVKAPAERTSAIDKVKGWLGSLFGNKKK